MTTVGAFTGLLRLVLGSRRRRFTYHVGWGSELFEMKKGTLSDRGFAMGLKGTCHGCGCETPSDCCWFCEKCVGNDTRSRLIEMAIAELEMVSGGKLNNPRVLTAIGCLMSLRMLS